MSILEWVIIILFMALTALMIKRYGSKSVLWVIGVIGAGSVAIALLFLVSFPYIRGTRVSQIAVTANRVESDGREYSRSVTVMDEVKTSESGLPSNVVDMEWKPSADTDYIVDTNPLSDRTELYISLLPWLVLLTIITLIAILILVLLRRKSVLWILGFVGGLALMGLFWVSLWLWPSESIHQTSVTASRMKSDGHGYSRSVAVVDEAKTSENGQPITLPSIEWKPSADFEFEADIYPSAVSAGLFAAKQLWSQMADKEELPPHPVLMMYVDRVSREYGAALAFALERYLPIGKVDILGNENNPPVSPEQPILQVSNPELTRDTAIEVQFIQVDLSYRDNTVRYRSRFSEKPWVEESYDSVSYSAHHDPSGRMVHSQGLYATREEAERQALNHVVDRIEDEARRRGLVQIRNATDREPFRAAVTSLLQSGPMDEPLAPGYVQEGAPHNRPLIKDRFTQSFNRPYGRVYRQALLLDVPAQAVVLEIVSEANASLREARRTKLLTHIASIAGMILLITVVYLFLNAATRGYYVWSLRVAGVVIVVAGVLLVLKYA